MIQTALALLLAHMLADFVAQTRWMVENKKRPHVLALHITSVALLSLLALGGGWRLVAFVATTHLLIDLLKIHVLPERLWAYLTDQALHMVVIALAAFWIPDSFETGFWATQPQYLLDIATLGSILLIGLIAATLAGGPVVGLLMQGFESTSLPEGLEGAGRMIGLLERAIIFLMVVVDQPAGIGFLIAAKSVLRFDTVSQNQRASEYVIIGTLASFAWAMSMGFAADAAFEALHPTR